MKEDPRILVLQGNGINCEVESAYAFDRAGATSYRIHVNDLLANPGKLHNYHGVYIPGGFSYGDHIRAGVVLANDLRYGAMEDIERFIADGKVILGVCNGFQILTELRLLPGPEIDGDQKVVTLTSNESGRFRDAWVQLKFDPDSPCIFTEGLDEMYLPIRHGEGNFMTIDDEVIARLAGRNQVAARYVDSEGRPAGGKYPDNPNGSADDIAGICDSTGRVFGLMPHPEGFHHFTNHPRWTRIKRRLRDEGKRLPEDGDGLRIFENAVRYIEENL